ncbi:MAG: SDR family oxidoreductase [Rhizorhabdus sp.]
MEKFEGKTAFVTGGASGIGFGIAKALAARGARVMIVDINRSALDAAVDVLGTNAAAFVLDVRDRDGWAAARVAVEQRFGPVDILVNNAGIGPDGHNLADMQPESFDRLVGIKLTGTFNGISTFAAGMRDRGEGHIVNTSSMAGLIAMAPLGAYCASKFAVVGLSEVLRAEMAPHGVGVSVLCPGLVRSNLAETTIAAGSDRKMTGGTSTAAGIDPMIVGELVIEAICANRLYIPTHGDYRDLVAKRMDRIVQAFDTVPVRDIAPAIGAQIALD